MLEQLDIVALIEKNPLTRFTKDYNSKFIERIQTSFTETQQQLFVSSFYCYLNYDSKNDFVIDIEYIWKWLGFSRKDPCKRILEKNFTLNIDYKCFLHHQKEQNPDIGFALSEAKKDKRGGHNKETIMMTIRTFKKLCLKTNTKKANEIHDYFIKLEETFHDIINEESDELRRQLIQEKSERSLLQEQTEELNTQLNRLTKKPNKLEPGQSVYIFQDKDENGIIVYKIGSTKDATTRQGSHRTSSFLGKIVMQVHCVRAALIEKIVHFLLDKYRISNKREWFTASYDEIVNAINYAKVVVECEIDFTNKDIINKIKNCLCNTAPGVTSAPSSTQLKADSEELKAKTKKIHTQLKYVPNDMNDFRTFLTVCCDYGEDKSLSYTMIKNQYKIWAKTCNPSQCQKLIAYMKQWYVTFMQKHNPLVASSKITQHFRGLSLKADIFKFEKPPQEMLVYENFLFEKCERSPNYRMEMSDAYTEFEEYYKQTFESEATYYVKERLKEFFDVTFLRTKAGPEAEQDYRSHGWLGVSLKSNEVKEPVRKYKPKNAKAVDLVDVLNNDIIRSWSCVTDAAEYLKKSRTSTSEILKSKTPFVIDGVQSILTYKV